MWPIQHWGEIQLYMYIRISVSDVALGKTKCSTDISCDKEKVRVHGMRTRQLRLLAVLVS